MKVSFFTMLTTIGLIFASCDNNLSEVFRTTHTGRTVAHTLAVYLHDCDVAGTKRSTWNDRITSVRISRVLDNDLLPLNSIFVVMSLILYRKK